MQLDQLYQEIILDHYKHPQGRGLRSATDPDARVAEAHHVNPTCGDEVTVRVATDGAVLTDISYDGMGCSISQASAACCTNCCAVGAPGRPRRCTRRSWS
jgi:nitrogen fixation NifU-like protein